MKIVLKDNKQSGQALVEFALIIGLVLLFMFGMIVVGYFINAQQVVTSAARSGAREASLTLNEGTAKGAVKVGMSGLYNEDEASNTQSRLRVSVNIIDIRTGTPKQFSTAGRSDLAQVSVEYDLPFTFGFLDSFVGRKVFKTVRSTSTAAVECKKQGECPQVIP